MPQPRIMVTGLRELRKDLKAMDKGLPRALNAELRKAVLPVAGAAKANAPRRTGALADSIRPYATARSVGIRSRLPYAAVHEYGGTIRPKGAPVVIRQARMVGRAIDRRAEELVDAVGDAIESVARRNGFS